MINPEKQSSETGADDYSILSKIPPFNKAQAEQALHAEVDQGKLENFNKFVNFVQKDTSIKRTLANLVPYEQDFYGDAAANYADKLYEGYKDIRTDLESIMQDFYRSEIIEGRLGQIEKNVINAGTDQQKLMTAYNQDFADISEKFNDAVRREVVGYSLFSNPHTLDRQARSINEILRLIHAAIVNNEGILHSLPVLKSSEGKAVNLYGTPSSQNAVAEEIFSQLKNSDEFLTDIVSLPNRTIMMVRDRGHALTIDIEQDSDKQYYANYFIPKICNADKVNKLPGVRKVKKGNPQDFTTGVFRADRNNIAKKTVGFVTEVPIDDDIATENV